MMPELEGFEALEDEFNHDNRFTWTIVLALLIAFACSCFQLRADEPAARIAVIDAQITAKQNARPDLPNDFDKGNGQADPTNTGAGPSTSQVSASVLATLAEFLGPSGRLILIPDDPQTIRRQDTALTIQPGTEIGYKLNRDTGTLTFKPPQPQINARIFGMRVTPDLRSLTLYPDNTGTAHATSNGLPLPPKRFRLGWEDGPPATDAPNGIGPTSPIAPIRPITFYTATWCGPCVAQKAALSGSRLKNFVEVIQIDSPDLLPYTHKSSNGRYWSIPSVPSLVWTDQAGAAVLVHTVADLERNWVPP